MSNVVFPSQSVTPGLSWGVKQRPTFNNKVQRAVSGKELRTALMQYPLWEITLSYDVLRDAQFQAGYNELETMVGFFCARQGAFDSFLFNNLTDNTATSTSIGTGTGNQTAFQLCRTLGANGYTFNEPVNNVNTVTAIQFNGVTQNVSNYSVSSTGLVTFFSAPGANVPVTWNGTYYYRTRFQEDASDFESFMRGLWELKQLTFVGSVVNKV